MNKKIKFTSNINHNDEKSKISFTSPVEISNYKEFKTYEFIEPENNIMNRIEVSDDKVNIFAAISTINLELGTLVPIEYKTPQGSITFDSNLLLLERTENTELFKYELLNNNKLLGTYEIKLEIQG